MTRAVLLGLRLPAPRAGESPAWRVVVSLVLLLAALVSCGRQPANGAAETQLVVFAAASLRGVFTEMGNEFEHACPGIVVTFNFAGTQQLKTQIEQGARVDVFASADERHMQALVRAGRVRAPVVFARGEPVIVVAKESASSIRSLADLPSAARIVIGAPDVPIGRYTVQILERASATLGDDFRERVQAKVVSNELNVRQVLSKVSLGEADAGIVYRTDALAAGNKVSLVAIPKELNVVATYPIAIAAGAEHSALAGKWLGFVLSERGQHTLGKAGFLSGSAGNEPHQ